MNKKFLMPALLGVFSLSSVGALAESGPKSTDAESAAPKTEAAVKEEQEAKGSKERSSRRDRKHDHKHEGPSDYLNIGLGLGEYRPNVDLTPTGQKIYSLKLSAYESRDWNHDHHDCDEWQKYDDEAWFPESIYFTDSAEGEANVYGFSYGPKGGVALGPDFAQVVIHAGVQVTYLNLDTPVVEDNHILTLGLTGGYGLLLKPAKYVHIEIGQNHQWNIGNDLSNGRTFGSATEMFAMAYVSIPLD